MRRKKKIEILFVFPRSVCYNILLCDNLTLIQAHWASQLKKEGKEITKWSIAKQGLTGGTRYFPPAVLFLLCPALTHTYCTALFTRSLSLALSRATKRGKQSEKKVQFLKMLSSKNPKSESGKQQLLSKILRASVSEKLKDLLGDIPELNEEEDNSDVIQDLSVLIPLFLFNLKWFFFFILKKNKIIVL